MKRRHPKHMFLLMGLIIAMVSCGTDRSFRLSGGGIGGTGIAVGPISDFGSVVVNGIHFDTRNALISIDHRVAGKGNRDIIQLLDRGKIVIVEGQIHDDQTGSAVHIHYSDTLSGPITEIAMIDENRMTLKVLHQTLLLNRRVHFKNCAYGDFRIGDIVSVSGQYDGKGLIRVGFINRTDLSKDREAKGKIRGNITRFNRDDKTFRLNDLTVNFASLNDISDQFYEGQWVDVEGRISLNGDLIAASIQPSDDIEGNKADLVVINGFLTKIDPNGLRIYGYKPILLGDNVHYVSKHMETLQTGDLLKISGTLQEGHITATKIEVKPSDSLYDADHSSKERTMNDAEDETEKESHERESGEGGDKGEGHDSGHDD